jgi:O-succinylbenzoic acid--CoA ligase
MQVEAWLQRAACSAPTLTAIQTPDARLSYGELWSAARAGAAELAERGVYRGERVAIALAPGIAFAQALHACMLLGAIVVPVDLRLTAVERERIIGGASTIVDEPLRAGPHHDSDEPLRAEPHYDPDELDSPIAFGLPERHVRADSDELEVAAVHDLDAVCAVIHTSGTTSAPRPVELSYCNFLWSALGSAVALGLDPQERWLCALPVSHVGGLSILLRSTIYATTAVIHERFDTDAVLGALEQDQITLVSLVSTTLTRLLDAGLHDPPRLRCALTGGGPVPAALVQRAHEAGVPVAATYGLTEACSQVTTGGPPLFCTHVDVGEDGEILVSGPTIARGSQAADGRLYTGDLGHIDANGFLHVSGRKADTIVTGGENVAPSEVEAVLEAHPAVLEAAVLGRADPRWGEAVTAIVVLAPRARVEESVLREYCSARLARFKVPKRVEFSSAPLPRTRSGKLLRRDLEGESAMGTVRTL